MKRREFNQLTLGLGAQLAVGSLFSGCTTALIPLDSKSYSGSKGRIITTSSPKMGTSIVRIVSWDDYSYSEFEIPLDVVHSIVQDHADRHVLYFFEIFGSAAKVNLKTGSIMKVDHRRRDALFNGHGALSVDNDFIACTEISNTTGTTVRLRSTKDLRVIDELPVPCRSCHQVVALPGTTILASGNTLSDGGALTFYDYREQKVVGQFKTPSSVVHLVALSSTEVLGTCMNDKGRIPRERFKTVSESMSTIDNLNSFTSGIQPIPAPLAYADVSGHGRVLIDNTKKANFVVNYGVSKAPGNRFLSTHMKSGKLLVWNNFEIEREIDVVEPKNVQVSDDGSEFVVLADVKLRFYSMRTFELIKQMDDWPGVTTISSYT